MRIFDRKAPFDTKSIITFFLGHPLGQLNIMELWIQSSSVEWSYVYWIHGYCFTVGWSYGYKALIQLSLLKLLKLLINKKQNLRYDLNSLFISGHFMPILLDYNINVRQAEGHSCNGLLWSPDRHWVTLTN